MRTIFQDFRFALRVLLRKPGLSALSIVTLALGIGACTTIFSVLNGIVLRPLPYDEPDRLAMIWTSDEKRGAQEHGTSFAAFEDWRSQSRSFEDMAVFMEPRLTGLNLSGIDEPLRIQGARVSPNLFDLLGVRPTIGRTFSTDEAERGERVIVIGYQLWQRLFGGLPEAVGSTLDVEGSPAQVVGVMPADFRFPNKDTQVWEPHTAFPQWPQKRSTRFSNLWVVVGRLTPNASIGQAQTEMDTIARRLEEEYPGAHAGLGVRVVPLHLQVTGERVRLAVWILFVAVVFVLLIACANVASLLLARGSERAREMGLRIALGAGRGRLFRQLITESALLALLAGFVGFLVSLAGLRLLMAVAPKNLPRLEEVGLSTEVLMFTITMSLATALVFGLVPGLKISATDPNEHLQEGSRRTSSGLQIRSAHKALAVLEFALAVVLLSGAGLLLRSFQNIQNVDPGFRPERALSLQVAPSKSFTRQQRAIFYREILEAINGIAGVDSAGVISNLFSQRDPEGLITAEGRPPTRAGLAIRNDAVSPGFFRAVGARLLQGRLPDEQDNRGEPLLVVINETMARRFWPGEDAVGRRLKWGGPESERSWMTVIGVVADMRRGGIEREPVPEMFVANSYLAASSMDLLVRMTTEPLQTAAAVREAIWSVDGNVPIYDVSTLSDRWEELGTQRRMQTWLLTLFGVIALVMAMMGIYGLQYYSVSERSHEIGIRMALGAKTADVLMLIIREGLIVSGIGLLAGLVSAQALTRFLSSQLYGVAPEDPVTIAMVSLVLIAVTLMASWIPAHRATRVDPMVALRYE